MKKRKKVNVFEDLQLALADSLRYERGERVDLRVTELPPPPRRLSPSQIREIRRSVNASQARFAAFLNVSTNTVESWEQGARKPREAALKLLNIVQKHPRVLLEA